jgi:hypothetical protein
MRGKTSLTLPAILTLLLTLSSSASAAIRITKIYFDPPGNDTPATKKKLNKESS